MAKEEHLKMLNSLSAEVRVLQKDFIEKYSPYEVGDKFEPNKSITKTLIDDSGNFYYEICLVATLGFYHQDNYEVLSLQELLDNETFKEQ